MSNSNIIDPATLIPRSLITLNSSENWFILNNSLKEKLGLTQSVRVYKGIGHAIYETLFGTATYFSHKRSVGYVTGGTPIFESLIPHFLRETYEVQKFPLVDIADSEKVKNWVESLKKDTVFVAYPINHPFTGELWDTNYLDELLNQKKIYSVACSHSLLGVDRLKQLKPYSIQVCSLNSNFVFVSGGERFRTPAVLASDLPWDQEFMFLESDFKFKEDKNLVLDFEKEFVETLSLEQQPKLISPMVSVESVHSFSHQQDFRSYDRSVLTFLDLNAEALLQMLFKKLKLSPSEGWKLASTPSMCHWTGFRLFSSWSNLSEEQLRGLCIFSLELLKQNGIVALLKETYHELQQRQKW